MNESDDVMLFDSLLQSADENQESVMDVSNVNDNRRLVALICYSSGTTGKPKGCMQTHHSLIANGCMNKLVRVIYYLRIHFLHKYLISGDVM